MKKQYIKPTLEAAHFELQGVIAVSNKEVNISNNTTDADALMSKKKGNPWSHTWE